MEEKLYLTTTEEIQNLIYTIRGKPVMIDSDVANLYHYETKRINETVKRNSERFPEEFCFRLTLSEFRNLKSQIATSSLEEQNEYGGRNIQHLKWQKQQIFMTDLL